MSRLLFFLAAFLLVQSIFAAPAPPTSNRGTIVFLRIEGDKDTIFERPIFTRGHDVETKLGGKHKCDGTNLDANPTPGPTATSALDDASKLRRFPWDGKFFPEFEDYLVSNIDGVLQTQEKFWNLFNNYKFAEVGGCQLRVRLFDEVLWAYASFDEPALKLTGPKSAFVGKPVILTVTDGRNGSPIPDAWVDGAKSDENGHVTVKFDKKGIHGMKANKPNTIRSNRVDIVVV